MWPPALIAARAQWPIGRSKAVRPCTLERVAGDIAEILWLSILESDMPGEVVALGHGVGHLPIGDRIVGITPDMSGDACAESFVSIPRRLPPIPPNLWDMCNWMTGVPRDRFEARTAASSWGGANARILRLLGRRMASGGHRKLVRCLT